MKSETLKLLILAKKAIEEELKHTVDEYAKFNNLSSIINGIRCRKQKFSEVNNLARICQKLEDALDLID